MKNVVHQWIMLRGVFLFDKRLYKPGWPLISVKRDARIYNMHHLFIWYRQPGSSREQRAEREYYVSRWSSTQIHWHEPPGYFMLYFFIFLEHKLYIRFILKNLWKFMQVFVRTNKFIFKIMYSISYFLFSSCQVRDMFL